MYETGNIKKMGEDGVDCTYLLFIQDIFMMVINCFGAQRQVVERDPVDGKQ